MFAVLVEIYEQSIGYWCCALTEFWFNNYSLIIKQIASTF